jgi:hypothetical protein
MSERSVMRKTKMLEDAGLLVVTRLKIGAKNAINRYALRGVTKSVVCGSGGASVTHSQRKGAGFGDTQSHLNRVNDIEHEMNDDIDILREGENSRNDDAYGESVDEAKLRDFGLRGVNVRRMAQRLQGRVDEAIRVARDKAVRNPAGYLVRMVDEGWAEASRMASAGGDSPFAGTSWEDFADMGDDFETRDADDIAGEQGEVVRDAYAIHWDLAQHQMQLQMGRGDFDATIQGATYLGTVDGVTRIQCRHRASAEWAQGRYYRVLKKIWGDIVGYDVELKFEAPAKALGNPFENPFSREAVM